ncbi:MAG TPA: hypothetical protein VNI36_10645 [Candidatus Dormibacteraeota bacterium]|nr:hypothetical protein [Candidatus Dormibacteraeota bacterium]
MQRLEVLQSYASHTFLDPGHQVVFESIRALLPGGMITPARLNVHLNNRGFPDIDTAWYFAPAQAGGEPRSGTQEKQN